MNAITKVNLSGIEAIRQGKVRTIFELGPDRLMITATDRISAFDVVLPTGIPGKGVALTQISNFWFDILGDVMDNHLIETQFHRFPENVQDFQNQLAGRSVIVRKAEVVPFECIVRGYISGSLWKLYKQGKPGYGIEFPEGLQESDKLKEPIFTPTTKAESGHDMPVSEKEMANQIGTELTRFLKEKSIEIYLKGDEFSRKKGIILADTKFEFGMIQDQPLLVDEVLTPDSSRFWPANSYTPGRGQSSYDKQFVRDYLETLNWDKTSPGPELPKAVVENTRLKYFEVYRRLTGEDLEFV